MDSARRATYHQQDNTILAVIRKGYNTFADIINWFAEKDNYPFIRQLMASDCEYKIVYIPDGSVELTPDRIVLAKTIILQNIRLRYHCKSRVYMYIQCKWCHHISQARFVRPYNASEVRPFYTKYCPLVQDKCEIHWGSYDKVTVVNSPSTAIVVDDSSDSSSSDESDTEKELKQVVAASSATRPHLRRLRRRMKYTPPRAHPYWKPAAAVITPAAAAAAAAAVVVVAEPYQREPEAQAQNIISVLDISSEEEEEEK
jgi:hypothetical protein